MSTSFDESVERTSRQLTEPAAVLEYMKISSIPTRDVRRIHVGSTNFAYRLFLDQALGETQQKTAILKFSAPYTATEPRVPFSAQRQMFEARALKHIPWKEFRYEHASVSEAVSTCRGVTLPEVFRDDRENHLTIVEDCTPKLEDEGVWDQTAHSFRTFLEGVAESEEKHRKARTIGYMLGEFLSQLHAWGSSVENHHQAVKLFGANTYATDLNTEETFTDFFDNVEKTGYQISHEQRSALKTRIEELENAVRTRQETVVMGDFWMGNVLMSFNKDRALSNVTVIDWEFVSMGPTFLDVGNFIGELFLINFFESTDSTYVSVLESFIQAYVRSKRSLDVRNTLGFAGAHIMMSLPRRFDSERSRATKSTAGECVKLALDFLTDPDFTYMTSRKDDPFANIAQLMMARRNAIS